MRVLQFLFIFILAIALSNVTFGFGSSRHQSTCLQPSKFTMKARSCNPCNQSRQNQRCVTIAYQNPCPEGICARYESTCQCTDEGWRYNCCISHCRYCKAFGNVGAR